MKHIDKKDYWFRGKAYGWGWGMPLKRQGWFVYGAFVAIWLLALWILLPSDMLQEPSRQDQIAFWLILLCDVLFLGYFSFRYGEPPRWRWGGKTRHERARAKES